MTSTFCGTCAALLCAHADGALQEAWDEHRLLQDPASVYANLLRGSIKLRLEDALAYGGHQAIVEELVARIEAQAVELMGVLADLSTARTEAANLKGYIEQAHRDFHSHNHCWRNLERLFEQAGLQPKRRNIPPLEEAMAGCRAFWIACEKEPERWPDFIEQAGTE